MSGILINDWNECVCTLRVFPDEASEDTGEGRDAEGVFKENLPKAVAAAAAEETPGPDGEYEEYTGAKT